MKYSDKTLHETAMKFCRKGCPANYLSCNRCQEDQFAKAPMLGTNTICPLAKYKIPERPAITSFMQGLKEKPDISDCNIMCMGCEHCTVAESKENTELLLGNIEPEEYTKFCLDCPVEMIREHLLEFQAEGRMS